MHHFCSSQPSHQVCSLVCFLVKNEKRFVGGEGGGNLSDFMQLLEQSRGLNPWVASCAHTTNTYLILPLQWWLFYIFTLLVLLIPFVRHFLLTTWHFYGYFHRLMQPLSSDTLHLWKAGAAATTVLSFLFFFPISFSAWHDVMHSDALKSFLFFV